VQWEEAYFINLNHLLLGDRLLVFLNVPQRTLPLFHKARSLTEDLHASTREKPAQTAYQLQPFESNEASFLSFWMAPPHYKCANQKRHRSHFKKTDKSHKYSTHFSESFCMKSIAATAIPRTAPIDKVTLIANM
jgi:hypothetical protein